MNSLYLNEGSMMEQLLVKAVNNKVVISQEEAEKINFKVTPEGFQWNEKEAKDLEVTFSDTEITFLRKQVGRLDSEKKINQQNLDLCVKIKEYKKD